MLQIRGGQCETVNGNHIDVMNEKNARADKGIDTQRDFPIRSNAWYTATVQNVVNNTTMAILVHLKASKKLTPKKTNKAYPKELNST